MLAGVTVLCAGVTLGIIAGLGQTTSTAAASAIAGAAGIKVGTASFYLYGVFFLLQLLMLRSKFEWERCFQLLPILAHGVLLNFFRYRFAPFQYLAPQGYLQQLTFFQQTSVEAGCTSIAIDQRCSIEILCVAQSRTLSRTNIFAVSAPF